MKAGDLGAFSVLPGRPRWWAPCARSIPLVREMVENRLKELCNAIALGFGATATVHYERIYPATINTESERCLLAMWLNLWWGGRGARPGAQHGR